jgi:hypothetical protein
MSTMFQDFSARQSSVGIAPATIVRQEAAELIDRYPNLSEIELARLVSLYRKFSALDAALIISDEQLGPKLDRFFADHRSKVRVPFRQYAGLIGYVVLTIAAVAWAVIVAS